MNTFLYRNLKLVVS